MQVSQKEREKKKRFVHQNKDQPRERDAFCCQSK